jgi:transposase
VEQAPNAVLHPWLKGELEQILAELPPDAVDPRALPAGHWWSDWGWSEEQIGHWRELPPIRLILIWDNLAGHHTWEMVRWCVERGILLLYTPLSGSWLNMAESLLRILGRRALSGQHPKSAAEVMEWLAATVRGWNAAPTPFEWGGKRARRRQRARERRHRLGGSGAYTRRPLPRSRRCLDLSKRFIHAN